MVADRGKDLEAALPGVYGVRLEITCIEGNFMCMVGLNAMFICSVIGVSSH